MLKLSGRLAVLVSIVSVAWFAAPQSKPGPNASAPVPASAAAGGKTFRANCSACHGLDGSGGERAPSIASQSDAARLNDADLKRIVWNGIGDAGMPPFRSLGDANIKSLIAYLRVLQGKGGSAKLPGDPNRGASLFFGKARCADCHMAGGKGGFIAADLTTYGAGRMPAEIREDIVAPGTDPDHRAKQAVAVDHQGQKYSGIIRTEDNFSLVLETHSGEFVLLQKADLASLTYVAEPLMPRDYGTTLSPAELDDVVSYLMNLRRKDASSTILPNAKRHWEDEE